MNFQTHGKENVAATKCHSVGKTTPKAISQIIIRINETYESSSNDTHLFYVIEWFFYYFGDGFNALTS